MKILWTIFKSNFQRFFPRAAQNEWLAEATAGEHSFCANVICKAVRTKGRGWLIPVNLALFLLGLFVLIADDYMQRHTLCLLARLFGLAAACVFLVLKFDVWKLQDEKNVLKLIYIFSMGCTGSYATVTYVFLIAFENIAAYGMWGGF